MGRSAILGEQRNNYFCDVACGRGEMVSTVLLHHSSRVLEHLFACGDRTEPLFGWIVILFTTVSITSSKSNNPSIK